jgi:phosphatidylserine/phosphatidylglycerophosphate/cardiolipin synthase-like enzyme
VKLLIQPGDGISALVKGIKRAKKSIEIVIFRFDRVEIETALTEAVNRGVLVQALIAYTNRGGEKNLRQLEARLLAAGVTVARTADDLTRYHAKYFLIDRRELFLLAFNYTYMDIERSRSFALITTNPRMVQEAAKLFEADTKRQPYEAGLSTFVVSPANAREQLSAFIKGAKKELLVYDPKITDPGMIRVLEERSKAGVDIRIIGRLTKRSSTIEARKLQGMRLHTRSMVRDGRQVFIGSQSLRELELDARREVGAIISDKDIAAKISEVFEQDWAKTEEARTRSAEAEPVDTDKVAKKVAKAVAKGLPDVAPVVETTLKEVAGANHNVELDTAQVQATVQDAVKEAVQQVVADAIEEDVPAPQK